MTDIKIVFNKDANRSEAYDGNKMIGKADFEVSKDKWEMYHTEVNKEYGGNGIAAKLVDTVVDHARKANVKIIPTCPYVAAKFDKDSKYVDVDAR